MTILVTGGLGYIGSNTVVALAEAGYEPVIVDNLSNSRIEVLKEIEGILKRRIPFYRGDLLDEAFLERVFDLTNPKGVVHFAGFKAVGESVAEPLKYYENNVAGSMTLLKVMKARRVYRIVFSSSATVYDPAQAPPFEETMALSPVNPYGHSKLMVEKILEGLNQTPDPWSVGILRYFNPLGAHKSGLLGEDPRGIPNNLMPYITRVARGELEFLRIFGSDYDTIDGTGVRDYIHVEDLARGHIKALEALSRGPGLGVYNLGTGTGHSVMEVLDTFEKVNGVKIPYERHPRRPGDVAASFAATARAREVLGFEARQSLEAMCRDAWRYEKKKRQTPKSMNRMLKGMRYYKELEIAKELAIKAGEVILRAYRQSDYEIETKDDDSPVTTADREANALIVTGLKEAFGEIPVLAEESADDKARLKSDFCWLVDPLDGTREFIKGNDEFSVNIALVFRSRPVLGVIYVPTTDELYYAVEEEGSYLETPQEIKKLRVTNRTQELVALSSRSRVSPRLTAIYAQHQRIREVIAMGSSIKGCMIARGSAEIYYSLGKTMEWDTAAMEIIVTEAGGIFRQLDDTLMCYNRKNPLNEKGFYVLNNSENKLALQEE